MRHWTFAVLLLAALLALAMTGCQTASTGGDEHTRTPQESTWRGQGRITYVSQPVPSTTSAPAYVHVEEIIPETSTYKGEGRSDRQGETSHTRVVTPFGQAPGATVSGKQPMKIDEGTSPAVVAGPQGVKVDEAERGKTEMGGMKPVSWILQLWAWAVKILWFYAFAVVVCLVLALIPTTTAVGKIGLRVLIGWIPVLGGLVENRIAANRGKQAATNRRRFEEVVDGVELTKTKLEAWVEATNAPAAEKAAAKAALRRIVNESMYAEQDADTVVAVKTYKAQT